MNVMSALALSLMVGLAITWTKSKMMESLLDEVQNIVLAIVTKIIIPILPFFIASTFCGLAYEGTITKQFPVFIKVIIIVYDRSLYLDGAALWSCGRILGQKPD